MRLTCLLVASALPFAACTRPEPDPESTERAEVEPDLSVDASADERSPTVIARLPSSAAESLSMGAVEEVDGRTLLTLRLEVLGPEAPPILGRYERVRDQLHFRPALPLQPGTRYLATLTLAPDKPMTLVYETDAPAQAETTQMLSLDPTVDEIPANILRFYAHFSAPMRGGEDLYEHVHLTDLSTGEAVAMAWREIQLWSVDRTRLTLLVHPGRVKRGITFAEELGPVLHAGRRYELVVDRELLDANGRPLAAPFRSVFEVIASDADGPRPEAWRLKSPPEGSEDPVMLAFDEPMDAQLVRTRIRVVDSQGEEVEGAVQLANGGADWQFTPSARWRPGAYALSLSGELEDLAGNTSTAPFDRPVGWKTDDTPMLRLPFVVGD